MVYQWYPGHMAKAKKQMMEDMKLIDVVIELVDARIPFSSKNPDIDSFAKGKSRIMLLNKCDLADEKVTARWREAYEKQGFFVACVNSKSGMGVKGVTDIIMKACAEKLERDRKKGIIGRPVRAMILGIPNVGKSTFINSFAGKSVAKTGNKPGVTKGKQWIRLNRQVELLDTPGILWPKFDDQDIGLRIALIGSINDEILVTSELADRLILFLQENYPGLIREKYKAEEDPDPEITVLNIAEARSCMKKGGVPDTEKVCSFLVDDFRNARIGRISLEWPENGKAAGATAPKSVQGDKNEDFRDNKDN